MNGLLSYVKNRQFSFSFLGLNLAETKYQLVFSLRTFISSPKPLPYSSLLLADEFFDHTGLHDIRARARIQAKIERLAYGNTGDAKPVREGVSELRIDYGPGYRVYFKKQGHVVIILLAGGNKKTQARDIKTALQLAHDL